MSVTKISIIISAGSKMLRHVIVPSMDDSELEDPAYALKTGERRIDLPVSEISVNDPDPITTAIVKATGVVPPSSRCAIVVKANAISGNVVGDTHADPAIDTVKGCTLILHPNAVAGWTWSASQGLQPPPNVG